MKKLIWSLLFTVFIGTQSVQAIVPVTMLDALSSVKSYYGQDSTKLNYCIGELKTLTSIHSDTIAYPYDWLTDTIVDKWVVFVDEWPNKNWPHICRYFYCPKQMESSLEPMSFDIIGNRPPNITLQPLASNRKVESDYSHELLRDLSVIDSGFCDTRN